MAPGNNSSPCFAHLLVDGHVVDAQTRHDVAMFRNSERRRLYELRKKQSLAVRKDAAAKLARRLDDLLGDVSARSVAVYWPIRGELDLRGWMARISEKAATVSLPVVVRKDHAVEFHKWEPGSKMKRGFWNIPVPAEVEKIVPDTIIVPLVGVDENKFRLGNGGGYYDRTLAGLSRDTAIVGIGQSFTQMKTIFPMPWDIPMKEVLLAWP